MRRDIACGILALVLGVLAVYVSIHDHEGRISVLVRMTPEDPPAEIARQDPDFEFSAAHQDGAWYYAMALDPIATGHAHTLVEAGAYRYGHPAYAWVVGLLSLFGPRLVPIMLVAVSLASLFIAAVASSRIFGLLGRSEWGGIAIALNPGLLFAVTNDTIEAFAAAMMTSALWAWLSGRGRLASALLVGCWFAKEHVLLVPAGLALWEGVAIWRGGAPRVHLRRLLLLAPGPLLYGAWVVYVHGRFGAWSFLQDDPFGPATSFPVPLVGWFDSLLLAGRVATQDYGSLQIGTASLVLQIPILAAIVIGIACAIRLRTPVDAAYLLMAALMCFLTWRVTFFPKDLLRGVALAFVVLPMVIQTRHEPPDSAADGPSLRVPGEPPMARNGSAMP